MIKLGYKDDKPLHEQITQGLKELIISGVLVADEQLPSVRELAVSLTVNPNTVQRAYKTLETEGIIYSIRGKGNFVSDIPKADKTQIDALYNSLRDVLKELVFYGEEKDKIDNMVKNIYAERDEMDD